MAKEKEDVKEEEKDEEVVEENAEEAKEDAPAEEAEAKEEEKVDEEDEDEAVKRLTDKFLKMVDANIDKSKEDSKKGKMFADKKMTKETYAKGEKTGEFIKALFNKDHTKLQLLSEGTAADGGFLVPGFFGQKCIYLN